MLSFHPQPYKILTWPEVLDNSVWLADLIVTRLIWMQIYEWQGTPHNDTSHGLEKNPVDKWHDEN
jgi:hypothetical protein